LISYGAFTAKITDTYFPAAYQWQSAGASRIGLAHTATPQYYIAF
jgi:hypothetical protein